MLVKGKRCQEKTMLTERGLKINKTWCQEKNMSRNWDVESKKRREKETSERLPKTENIKGKTDQEKLDTRKDFKRKMHRDREVAPKGLSRERDVKKIKANNGFGNVVSF